MFEEYDVVYSTVDIDNNVAVGTKGVIMMILDLENEVYEVEFVDNKNETIEVIEVKGTQIEKEWNDRITSSKWGWDDMLSESEWDFWIYISGKIQSEQFINCLRELDKKFPELDMTKDIDVLLTKDSTRVYRSCPSVFLLLAILPNNRVKGILKLAKGAKSMLRFIAIGEYIGWVL